MYIYTERCYLLLARKIITEVVICRIEFIAVQGIVDFVLFTISMINSDFLLSRYDVREGSFNCPVPISTKELGKAFLESFVEFGPTEHGMNQHN